MSMKKQIAGRDSLGEFAPKFAQLNDDVLFGEVWSREDKLSLKLRSILTISALVSKGMVDSSFEYHARTAKADSWFSHIAIECPGDETSTEWLEKVDDKQYPTENK